MTASSMMLSKLYYGMPLYLGETQATKHRIYQTHMMLVRWIHNSFCFRKSIISMCREIKWNAPAQQMQKSSVIYFHGILSSAQPEQVLDLVRLPRTRPSAELSTKYTPKTEAYKNSCIYQMVDLYNKIPDWYKNQDHQMFKSEVKKNYISDDHFM